jgi:DNA-binding response OmpR family regulator
MEKPVVLVVDDEPQVGRILQIIVERYDGEIYVAHNAIEAIAYLQKINPDLIILDIMMPGLDGISLCKMLREREDTKEAYILIISAKSDIDTVGDVLNAGASDYWSKPLDKDWMNKIRNLLRDVLEKKEQRASSE